MTKFSDQYQDTVFYIWYEGNRPGSKKLQSLIPEENGNRPSVPTLDLWYRDYGWEQRADAIAGEESEAIKQEVIARRVEMFKTLERVGGMMVEKGETYLNDHGINSETAAIKAIVDGAEILRSSVGQAEAWFKISKMTNAQLDNAFRSLLNKGQNDVDIIDADTVSPEEPDESSTEGD